MNNNGHNTTSDGRAPDVVTVEHLGMRYGDKVAVDDVSFSVRRGEIFGILGPNGAGKTTTVECIGGLREPDGGDYQRPRPRPGATATSCMSVVGMQLQASRACPTNSRVGEALELFAAFYRRSRPTRLAERLGLPGGERQAEDRFAGSPAGSSSGCRSRWPLIGRPEVAILDELTTGLDPRARRDT